MAAPPGWSTHQRGVSVDIDELTVFLSEKRVEKSMYYTDHIDKWVEGGGCWEEDKGKGFICYTSLYYWLLEHARDYGFYKDVPGEYWHWTYTPSSEIAVGG
jgi:LAS superfamily LD-carboxypeptidase LdcB